MKQKEIEAKKYACDCRHDDGINPTFDSYDAQQMRECGFMRGYEAALTNQWINIKKERPENGAHCFVKKRELNDSKQWQWNYGIAEFIVPTLKKPNTYIPNIRYDCEIGRYHSLDVNTQRITFHYAGKQIPA